MAVTLEFYDQFIEFVGDHSGATAGIDVNNDTFKIELYNSTHAFVATHTARASIVANAVATGNGYTNPGENLLSVTWTTAGTDPSTQTWDAADVTQWTATGGPIPAAGNAAHAVIYDDTSVTPSVDLLVCSIGFGQNESAGDGTDFKITFNGSGIFTIAGT